MRTRTRIVLMALALTLAVVLSSATLGIGAPASAVDETKVPHYFGPYPNWANSPLTLPDVKVTIAAPGDPLGTTAEAAATIGANGAVTDLTITNPGSGYTVADDPVTMTITKADGTVATDPASATGTLTASGVVTGVNVTTPGVGYTKPTVVIDAPPVVPGNTTATATAFGGVDGLTITNLALVDGYHLPTVSFDMPDDPNGTIAEGKVICDSMSTDPVPVCVNPIPDPNDPTKTILGVVHITGIEITNPGSGYSSAPNAAILDGTQFEPAPKQSLDPDLVPATVASTISVDYVTVDTFGSGYTSVPGVAINNPAADPPPTADAVATATTTVGAITDFTILVPGSGYITAGGIKKFQDDLPGLCDPTGANAPACPDWTTTPTAPKAIPLAVSQVQTISGQAADTYEIGLVQYRTSFSSSLPDTLVRGYVQIDTGGVPGSQSFPLTNTVWDTATSSYLTVPVTDANGNPYMGVTAPQWPRAEHRRGEEQGGPNRVP